MRLPTLRRTRSAEPEAILGTARLDRRTKRLVGRLRPGDIAVIDHVDIDRVAELSRMLAGLEGSDLARGHAEELLAVAASAKAGR